MGATPPEGLKPRKWPRQARAEATVDAIFQATIQVLLKEGARRLTTTRVAERAGVSVGTMYQYFPHKQSLLYAVLQQHLNIVAEAVEAASKQHQGQSIVTMANGLVTAYVDAMAAHAETSRALYLVAAELDTADLLGGISKRIHVATAALLASAADAKFDDLPAVAFTLLAAMTGTTRTVFERGATPPMLRVLRTQLTMMCRAYLQAVAAEKATPRVHSARALSGPRRNESLSVIDSGSRGVTKKGGDLLTGEASPHAAAGGAHDGGNTGETANGCMRQPPANQLKDPISVDIIAGAMSRIPWMDQYAVLLETLAQIGQFEFPDPLERSYAALRAVVKYVDGNLPLSSRGLTNPLHALINALSDTLKGAHPEVLRPRRRGKGAPKDLSFSSVQGVLAGLLEVLIRAGVPCDSAARSIATQAGASKSSIARGSESPPKTLSIGTPDRVTTCRPQPPRHSRKCRAQT